MQLVENYYIVVVSVQLICCVLEAICISSLSIEANFCDRLSLKDALKMQTIFP